MSENTTKVIQFRGSEIDQIRKSASGTSFGEKRTEAANGDVIVGREKRREIRIGVEFGEGGGR